MRQTGTKGANLALDAIKLLFFPGPITSFITLNVEL